MSRYGVGVGRGFIRDHLFDEPERIEVNALIPEEEYELEQEIRIGSRYYDQIPMKEEFYPRISARYDRALDREEFLISQGYKAYGERVEPGKSIFQQNKEK